MQESERTPNLAVKKKKKNQDVSVMQEHCKITSPYYAVQVLEQINLAHKMIPLLTSFVSLAIF